MRDVAYPPFCVWPGMTCDDLSTPTPLIATLIDECAKVSFSLGVRYKFVKV